MGMMMMIIIIIIITIIIIIMYSVSEEHVRNEKFHFSRKPSNRMTTYASLGQYWNVELHALQRIKANSTHV
jgi:hypothetical protein